MQQITKNEELNKYAQLLREHGFTIIQHKPEGGATWFDFYKEGEHEIPGLGYLVGQATLRSYGQYGVSVVYQPQKKWGAGHEFRTGYADILTVENAVEALRFLKRLAKDQPGGGPVLYASLAAYCDDRKPWEREMWEPIPLDPIQEDLEAQKEGVPAHNISAVTWLADQVKYWTHIEVPPSVMETALRLEQEAKYAAYQAGQNSISYTP